MKKLNQYGSAVVVLLVLILVAVVGGVGYLVYSRQSTNNSQASTASTNISQGSKDTQKSEEALVIKEWDVKLNKPTEVADLTSEDYGKSGDLEWVRLTSPSLETKGTLTSGGPETREKIGLLYRAKPGAKAALIGCSTNEDCAEKNGWAHKTVNGYFYYYDPTHSSEGFFDTSFKTSIDKAVSDTLSAN